MHRSVAGAAPGREARAQGRLRGAGGERVQQPHISVETSTMWLRAILKVTSTRHDNHKVPYTRFLPPSIHPESLAGGWCVLRIAAELLLEDVVEGAGPSNGHGRENGSLGTSSLRHFDCEGHSHGHGHCPESAPGMGVLRKIFNHWPPIRFSFDS